MPGTNPKEIVIFLHGIRSSQETWNPLFKLLNEDETVMSRFELFCVTYSTKAVELRPDRRIPEVNDAANTLRKFIDSPEFYDRGITLVGHSLGGLVIQAHLAHMLQQGHGESLSPIRQIILMATPSLGSDFLSWGRKLYGRIFANPQELALRVSDREMADIVNFVTEHVVHATKATNNQWPIPFHIFYGNRDKIVLKVSARGGFPEENLTSLEADHSTINKPEDRNDQRYREFVKALLNPPGHSCYHEIDLYDTKVTVGPALGSREFTCKHGSKERIVRSDNIACIDRTVTFSRKNQCTKPFEIIYRTRHEGYLRVFNEPKENEASEAEIGTYDDHGVATVFRFTPQAGKTYRSKIDVYGGFGEGQRDVHFHIGKNSCSKRRVYSLDLTGYLERDYELPRKPTLHFHANDPGGCGDLCKARKLGHEVKPTRTDGRIWTWEFLRVRHGVVDMIWDVKKI